MLDAACMNLECSVKREAVFRSVSAAQRRARATNSLRSMRRAKRTRFVEYPNRMRVEVMQSKIFRDTYTGVVVDIVHGTNREAWQRLRQGSDCPPSPRQVLAVVHADQYITRGGQV